MAEMCLKSPKMGILQGGAMLKDMVFGLIGALLACAVLDAIEEWERNR